jgi:hypothetical protein
MERLEKGEEIKRLEQSDMEIVLFLIKHIDKPCKVEVDGKMENIRHVYINQANELLKSKKLTNPWAEDLLRHKIKEYEESSETN